MRYIFLLAFIIAAAYSAKIKDLASVIGVRENQVIGYGLVVGLSGTGDGSSSKFTIQSIANMLQSVNVKLSPNDIKSKNITVNFFIIFISAQFVLMFQQQSDPILCLLLH